MDDQETTKREAAGKEKAFSLQGYLQKLSHCLSGEIWKTAALSESHPRRRLYGLLRVFSLALSGLKQNNLFVRGAALSYYTLIALGPTIALMVMVSGFIIDQNKTDDFAADTINKIISFMAPSTQEMPEQLAGQNGGQGVEAKQQLEELINSFISSARSGTVGIIGTLMLIYIVIQLFVSIEKTLNNIWGVPHGRSFGQRFFFYWGFISLGAVLGFSAASLLSLSTIVHFLDGLPLGQHLARLIVLLAPFLAYLLISSLLASFYRFFPNTNVTWRAAFAGGLLATLLLGLNYTLSFLYVSRVISTTSLYGSLGIFPVLMIGLYVFWLFVLLGGQFSYAVQNAKIITHQEAWRDISAKTCETLSLGTFILISRRFCDCKNPYNLSELTALTRAPAHILNECLVGLQKLGWILAIRPQDEENEKNACYVPAKPLNEITVGQFCKSLHTYGNNQGFQLIRGMDPLLEQHHEQWKASLEAADGQKTFEQWLENTPCGTTAA